MNQDRRNEIVSRCIVTGVLSVKKTVEKIFLVGFCNVGSLLWVAARTINTVWSNRLPENWWTESGIPRFCSFRAIEEF